MRQWCMKHDVNIMIMLCYVKTLKGWINKSIMVKSRDKFFHRVSWHQIIQFILFRLERTRSVHSFKAPFNHVCLIRAKNWSYQLLLFCVYVILYQMFCLTFCQQETSHEFDMKKRQDIDKAEYYENCYRENT